MKVQERTVLVCDCERTMTLDLKRVAAALAAEEPVLHTHLCRPQVDSFRRAAAGGEPLLVCCTQEAPLFQELAAEAMKELDVAFVNIRERAGWSRQGRNAAPKVAALIAEATLALQPTPTATLRSDGVALVYGAGEATLAAARQLARRLNVTCVLTDADDVLPPARMDVPIFRGRIRQAKGYLGAFEVTMDAFAAAVASSRAALAFEGARDGAVSQCDVIVDLSGRTPLFPAPEARDGYFRAEPSDPVQVQRVLFDAADMVGEFEKPRYVKVDPALCAHSRNGIVGCDLCLNACPTAAIAPAGDHTAVDAYVCSGHGACASVCPTGAIVFDVPRNPGLFERLRVLARTYREADGRDMVLLVHDPRYGDDMISVLARTGRGLPAHVVPFAVGEITQIGLDFLLTAFAYGISQVRILAGPDHRDALGPLSGHAALVDAVMPGLGYDGDRVVVHREEDPAVLEAHLYEPPPEALAEPARHRVMGEKRTTLTAALDHLHARAPRPADVLALDAGAPFGAVVLDRGACTLCLACVGVCPTSALGDNPESPQLSFTEVNCVQCGLCRNTCPENAITLVPRLHFADEAQRKNVLMAEEPFRCIRCGKPFASPSAINRLVEKLAGHSMFAEPGRLDLIKMCEDCRVGVQFEDRAAPFAAAPRPRTRTTDDYVKGAVTDRDDDA